MKTVKVGYQHTFRCSEFMYDKIYIEVELQKDDTEEQAISYCIERTKEVEKRVQDGVSEDNFRSKYLVPLNMSEDGSVSPIKVDYIPGKEPEIKRIGVIAEDIYSTTDLKILETYRFIKETNPELKKAYDEQFAKLSNQKK